jgi:hypothetical protein
MSLVEDSFFDKKCSQESVSRTILANESLKSVAVWLDAFLALLDHPLPPFNLESLFSAKNQAKIRSSLHHVSAEQIINVARLDDDSLAAAELFFKYLTCLCPGVKRAEPKSVDVPLVEENRQASVPMDVKEMKERLLRLLKRVNHEARRRLPNIIVVLGGPADWERVDRYLT